MANTFGTTQLAIADARMALGLLNHMRYGALERAFGISREQANVVTAVLLLAAADGMFEATRTVTRIRPHVAGTDLALGAIALRDVSLGVAGPADRTIPGLGALLALGLIGSAAMPGLRRAARGAQRMREAEKRVRTERIRRYTEARAAA
jgi:hypothetical protein